MSASTRGKTPPSASTDGLRGGAIAPDLGRTGPWWVGSAVLHVAAVLTLLLFTPLRTIILQPSDTTDFETTASAERIEEVVAEIRDHQAEQLSWEVAELRDIQEQLEDIREGKLDDYDLFADEQAVDAPAEARKAQDEAIAAQQKALDEMAKALKAAEDANQAQQKAEQSAEADDHAATRRHQEQANQAQQKARQAHAEARSAQQAADEAQAKAANALAMLAGEMLAARQAQQEAVKAQSDADSTEVEAARRQQDALNQQQQAVKRTASAAAHSEKLERQKPVAEGLAAAADKLTEAAEKAKAEARKASDAHREASNESKKAERAARSKKADESTKAAAEAARRKADAARAVSDQAKAAAKSAEDKARAARAAASRPKRDVESTRRQVERSARESARYQEQSNSSQRAATEEGKKARAAQKKALEAQKKARDAVAKAASAPVVAEKAPRDGGSSDARPSLFDMNVAELYDTAVEAERKATEAYKGVRAAELAMIRRIPLADAIAQTDVARPVRPELDKELLTGSIRDMAGAGRHKREVEKAVREVESMVTLGRRLLALSGAGEGEQGAAVSMDWYRAKAAEADELTQAAMEDDAAKAKDVSGLMKKAASSSAGAAGAATGADGKASGRKGGRAGRPGAVLGPPIVRRNLKAVPGRKVRADGLPSEWMYVDSWYVIGPFPNPRRINRDKKFPPESVVDLDARYVGKGGQLVRWRFMQSPEPMVVPANAQEYAIYYAYTELWFEKAMDLWITVGSDDKSSLWVEDQPVWVSSNILKGWQIGEGLRKVHFKKGRNRILYRIENGWRQIAWSLVLHTKRR